MEELKKRIVELEEMLARSKEAHRWALGCIQAAKADHAKAQAEVTAMVRRYEPKRFVAVEVGNKGTAEKLLPRMLPPRWLLPLVAVASAMGGALTGGLLF